MTVLRKARVVQPFGGGSESVRRLEWCPRRGSRFDHNRAGRFEGARRGSHSCAGGDDIVDHEDTRGARLRRRELRTGDALPFGPARLGGSGLPHQE